MLAEEQDTPRNYGGTVPAVDADKALEIYAAMNKATGAGLLKSATTPIKGGLAVALSLACIGGQFGADVDLSDLTGPEGSRGGLDVATTLFSESNSRFMVTVSPEKAAELESLFDGMPIVKVGTVSTEKKLQVNGAVNLDIDTLVKPFKNTLYGV